jgi:hypothetical protein
MNSYEYHQSLLVDFAKPCWAYTAFTSHEQALLLSTSIVSVTLTHLKGQFTQRTNLSFTCIFSMLSQIVMKLCMGNLHRFAY